MPSLKSLRTRITSVKSTRKITSAMKMVSAAKLKRSQDAAVASRPYADRMEALVASLASNMTGEKPALLAGRKTPEGQAEKHLIIVATADRGLCGAFNASIIRDARALIKQNQNDGKIVSLYCVGRKGRDALRRDYGHIMLHSQELGNKKKIPFADAAEIAERTREWFESGKIDAATMIFAHFRSAIAQIVTRQPLIPAKILDQGAFNAKFAEREKTHIINPHAISEKLAADPPRTADYEPDEESMLATMLPRNLAVQIYRALLENAASEQGARMTAMDNATRNAGDMIARLTLNYNRTRQAVITKELIEIISGAEAV
ncbi:MAG: F0F1 ATP synthase subunit gamma [Alphaproteobacteria bacterium]|nr:F0F1 ATP synthase subunit gamma [Alphaproteobacteria bacterium]